MQFSKYGALLGMSESEMTKHYDTLQKQYEVLQKTMKRLLELIMILNQDLLDSLKQLTIIDQSSQFHRRNYIRTLFALIEGETFCLKSVALTIHELRFTFEPEEIALLREEQYSLDKKGKA